LIGRETIMKDKPLTILNGVLGEGAGL
jgi:hypothetical protein